MQVACQDYDLYWHDLCIGLYWHDLCIGLYWHDLCIGLYWHDLCICTVLIQLKVYCNNISML